MKKGRYLIVLSEIILIFFLNTASHGWQRNKFISQSNG